MFFFIVLSIAIGLSVLTYYLLGFFNQSLWYLFLLAAFIVGYGLLLFGLYWAILLLAAHPYKNKETKKVNMFFLFNIRLLASLVLLTNMVFVRRKYFKSIPKEPGLILFNHVSNYDFMTLYRTMWGRYAFIGKKELMKAKPTGSLACAAGTLFVDRSNPESGRVLVDDAVEYITKKKTSVLIAPEGTRSRTGVIAPFKHGGFHIALRSKCPITLICLKDMEKASQRRHMRPVKVTLVVIGTIKPEEYEGMTAGELAELCENKYKEFLNQA